MWVPVNRTVRTIVDRCLFLVNRTVDTMFGVAFNVRKVKRICSIFNRGNDKRSPIIVFMDNGFSAFVFVRCLSFNVFIGNLPSITIVTIYGIYRVAVFVVLVRGMMAKEVHSFLSSSREIMFGNDFRCFLLCIINYSNGPTGFIVHRNLIIPTYGKCQLSPTLSVNIVYVANSFSIAICLNRRSIIIMVVFNASTVLINVCFLCNDSRLSRPVVFQTCYAYVQVSRFNLVALAIVLCHSKLSSLQYYDFYRSKNMVNV